MIYKQLHETVLLAFFESSTSLSAHPERWRDRPDETSATARQYWQVPNPAEAVKTVVLEDEDQERSKRCASRIQRGILFINLLKPRTGCGEKKLSNGDGN
jgi:hypothetical protein